MTARQSIISPVTRRLKAPQILFFLLLLLALAGYLILRVRLNNTSSGETPPTVLPGNAGIPSLVLHAENTRLDYIEADKSNTAMVSIELCDSDGAVLFTGEARMKGHGNTSWVEHPKKSYDLKFSDAVSLLDMGAQEKWLLIANYADDSALKNYLALSAARRLDCAFSPEAAFVNLFWEEEYRGLYLLCQKIDVAGGSVAIHDLESENEKINRVASGNDPAPFEIDEDGLLLKGVRLEAYPSDLSGGYLMEFSGAYPYREATAAFTTASRYVIVKSPNNLQEEEAAYISGCVRAAEEAVFSVETDADYRRLKEEALDIPSWIQQYWLQEFFFNPDAEVNSTFFYKERQNPLLHAGPVWDMDRCMNDLLGNGMQVECNALLIESAKPENGNWGEMPWLKRLILTPAFREEAYAWYASDFTPVMEQLMEELPDIILTLDLSLEADCLRWEKSYEACRKEQEAVLEWTRKRHALFIRLYSTSRLL